MAEIPQGTVTLVFTDIVGSTRLWEQFPEQMRRTVAEHDQILREIFARFSGYVFKTVGDAFCAAFASPKAAIQAAVLIQKTLAGTTWPEVGHLQLRIGVHTGPAELREGDYFGGTVNRCARIESAAHGGQILLSKIVMDLLADDAPVGLGFKPLGKHRLRSLERPEHLFQVTAEGLALDFPPPKSLEILPNNLPLQTTSFVGREEELKTVGEAISEKTRLLTLVGTGGTGKTRLAIEVGALLVQKFSDGVWLVELALISDAAGLLEAIAKSVGVREEADSQLRETLLQFLAPRQTLLILDNCEHLNTVVASLVSDILKTCPTVKILATNRHLLGIRGEMSFPVPPLRIFDVHRSRQENKHTVEEILAYDAVKLFVDRASAIKPEFTVNRENAEAIAEICSRLDGIPLAIELAAARSRLLQPAQIAERLHDRFRLLKGGTSDHLPHQQTLQALIDWSHDLLSLREKTLFRRLGVFVGGRDLEAIEAVCRGGEVQEEEIMDLLQELVEKSLVYVEAEQTDQSPRYTMTESVWQYAREKLWASGEGDDLRNRHLDFFLDRVEQASPHFEGPQQKQWLDRFDLDTFNYQSAVSWSIRSGLHEKGMRMLIAMARPLEVRGFLSEAWEQYRQILEITASHPSRLRALTLQAAGRIAWALDRYEEAREFATQAEEQLRQFELSREAMMCQAILAFLDRGDGRTEEAESRFTKALQFGEQSGEPRLTAVCQSGLGSIAMDRNDLPQARQRKEAALAIYRELGDWWIIGLVLWGLAKVAIAQSDFTRAHEALREWIQICRELGNRWAFPYILETEAEAALAEGNPETATLLFGLADTQRSKAGVQFSPSEKLEHDRLMQLLNTRLPKEDLAALWKQGQQIAAEQALTAILQQKPLTAREGVY